MEIACEIEDADERDKYYEKEMKPGGELYRRTHKALVKKYTNMMKQRRKEQREDAQGIKQFHQHNVVCNVYVQILCDVVM